MYDAIPTRTKSVSERLSRRGSRSSATTHFMRVDYNPYEGMTIPGSPAWVFSRGNAVSEGDTFVGRAGDGQYLKRGQYNLP